MVVAGRTGGPTTDLYDIDSLTFSGKGVAANAAPEVSITADSVSGVAPFPVSFVGNVLDPEGGALTYAWDFDSNGTTDATTKDATYVYTAVGTYTATLTATDAGGKHQKATIRVDATTAVASCPGDDDFLGTSLNSSRWTVTREDPTAMNVSGGSLNITSQNFDIHGGGTGLRNIVHQPLPTSGAWTATIKANWDPTTNYNNAGLMVYGDDANFIKAGMVWSGGRKFEAFKELNNTATALGSATANMPATFPTTWYLRLTSNGTTIQPAYSADGVTWTNYGATTNLTGITAPKIGVYATSASAVNRDFKVDWFKLTTPQSPSDEFDGNSLNLCRWNAIVRHEPGGYTVADGKLTLPAAHGDFFGSGANNNPNMLLQQPAPPSGPWTMETRLTFNPNENYEQAGLLLYSDDQNYVKADLVFAGNRALEFLNEVNGTAGGFDNTANISTRPTTVDLRIVSDGTNLRAYYHFDGDASWTQFGTATPLSAAGPSPKFGLYANDSNATVTSRDNAVFDYFRITTGGPDTTAPTSAATAAGDRPRDGDRHGRRRDRRLGPGQARVPARRRCLDPVHHAGRGDSGRGAHARAPRHRQGGQRRHGGQRVVHDRRRACAGHTGGHRRRRPERARADDRLTAVVRRVHTGRDARLHGVDHGGGHLHRGRRKTDGVRPGNGNHGQAGQRHVRVGPAAAGQGDEHPGHERSGVRLARNPGVAVDLQRARGQGHRDDRLQAVDR